MGTCVLNLVDEDSRTVIEGLAKSYGVGTHVAAAMVLQVGVGTVSAGQRIDAALTAAAKGPPTATETMH